MPDGLPKRQPPCRCTRWSFPHRRTYQCSEHEDEANTQAPDEPFRWPFRSDNEEHRHFDNQERAADMRAALRTWI